MVMLHSISAAVSRKMCLKTSNTTLHCLLLLHGVHVIPVSNAASRRFGQITNASGCYPIVKVIKIFLVTFHHWFPVFRVKKQLNLQTCALFIHTDIDIDLVYLYALTDRNFKLRSLFYINIVFVFKAQFYVDVVMFCVC